MAYAAVRISYDLYGNKTLSAFRMAKSQTKSVYVGVYSTSVSSEIPEAQKLRIATCKVVPILRTKCTTEPSISPGDSVYIFHKLTKEKRGRSIFPRTVVSVYLKSGAVTAPGYKEPVISAAFEDLRMELPGESLAHLVEEGIDHVNDAIDSQLVNTSCWVI